MKIYLAHPISNEYEARASIETANKLRNLGFEVYAAAENKSINDKTNNPTPLDIYNADIAEINECDIFIVNITGGMQEGTICEIGYVAGLNEWNIMREGDPVPILAYTTNSRLANPQEYWGIPSAHANHLVLGAIAKWGCFVGSLNDLIERMREME